MLLLSRLKPSLPPSPDERQEIETRARETTLEIDGLKALRLLLEQSQKQIAQSLGIKQHAVHKMKRQTDLYLSADSWKRQAASSNW